MTSKPYKVTLLIKNSDCKVINFLKQKQIDGLFIFVKCGYNSSVHLLRVPNVLKNDLSTLEVEKYELRGDFLWVRVPSCKMCKILSNSLCIPANVRFVTPLGVLVVLLVPTRKIVYKILKEMERQGLSFRITNYARWKLDRFLTRKQRQMLLLSVEAGYFDEPKRINLRELSARTGLNPTTVLRQIKAAVRKIGKQLAEEYLL